MSTITIHTDGACHTQSGQGGWAAILTSGAHRKVLTGSAADTTSNAMELTAVIAALCALKSHGQTVTLHTDSQYVAKGINTWLPDWVARGWQTAAKKPVANRTLWEQLHALLGLHTVTVTWIPREQNHEADALAQAARNGQSVTENTPTPKPQGITHVFISGSPYPTREMLSCAERAVRRAHERGYTVLVGDAPSGIDLAVVRACRRWKVPVLVAGTGNVPRNKGCWHGRYVKVATDTYRGADGRALEGDTVLRRWLADNAQIGLFVWDGYETATPALHESLQARGKDAHLLTFSDGVGA